MYIYFPEDKNKKLFRHEIYQLQMVTIQLNGDTKIFSNIYHRLLVKQNALRSNDLKTISS